MLGSMKMLGPIVDVFFLAPLCMSKSSLMKDTGGSTTQKIQRFWIEYVRHKTRFLCIMYLFWKYVFTEKKA